MYQIRRYHGKSDVLASSDEAFGMVLVEAMDVGTQGSVQMSSQDQERSGHGNMVSWRIKGMLCLLSAH